MSATVEELVAEAKAQPIVVSNSSIQTFKDCRRKFWLSYYRRLKPKREKTSGPLALGSRVHRALELYYIEFLKDPSMDQEAVMMAIWAELIEADRLLLEAEDGVTDEFTKEAELGRLMLEGYVAWIQEEGIDSDYEVVSQEETLRQEMLDGKVLLVGKIDQRVRRRVDGVRFIRDFKTAAQFADLEKTIEMQEQFILYMVLEQFQKEETERVEGAIVTALKKVKRTANAKPPFYKQTEVQHNIFTLRNFYKRLQGELNQIVEFWEALDRGEDHQIIAYPSPTRDCSWKCDFHLLCPMFDNGSAIEQALADQFEVGDPYDYYGDSSPLKEN